MTRCSQTIPSCRRPWNIYGEISWSFIAARSESLPGTVGFVWFWVLSSPSALLVCPRHCVYFKRISDSATLLHAAAGLKQFFKPLWKDFRSKFGHLLADLARHKVTIESHAQQMHIQQYMTDREEIFRCFEEIKRGEDRKKYLLVREWLDATDPEADHENALKVRQDFPKSGMWIFDNKNVRDWRLASPPKSSILWISGKPGAGELQWCMATQHPTLSMGTVLIPLLGKSILASVIIEELRKENALPLAFFYCKNADPSRRSYVHVMKGLLAQLIHHERHVVPYYYDKAIASSGQTLASARAIAAYLHDMMRVTENAVIVIDGLDECERDERNDILTSLVDLVHQCDYDRPGKLRLCIVSRNEKDIRDHLRTARHFALSSGDNRDDIKMYVDHWAAKITQLFKLGPSDQSYIVRNVMERTQGKLPL